MCLRVGRVVSHLISLVSWLWTPLWVGEYIISTVIMADLRNINIHVLLELYRCLTRVKILPSTFEILSISPVPCHELLITLNNIKSGVFTSAAMGLSIVFTFTRSTFYPYKNNMMVLPSLCWAATRHVPPGENHSIWHINFPLLEGHNHLGGLMNGSLHYLPML